MQYAGGILLTPVQTLVATLIKSIPVPCSKKESHPFGWFLFFKKRESNPSICSIYFMEQHLDFLTRAKYTVLRKSQFAGDLWKT
jgi:hypothetical protein